MPGLDPNRALHSAELAPTLQFAGQEFVGQPYSYHDENSVGLVSQPKHAILSDSEFGNVLAGPLSLLTTPENISMSSGYFKMNPLLLSMVGSCAALPVPLLVPGRPAILGFMNRMKGLVDQQVSLDMGAI